MKKIGLPKNFVSGYPHKFSKGKERFLCGQRISPAPITGRESVADLIDGAFLA